MENAISIGDRIRMAKFCLFGEKFTNGEKVISLENQWNNWLGSKYSLFVSSGSTANFLLLAAIKEKYNLKQGDKVLVPACTWMTNVAPIIQLGLTPVFCDIQLEDFSFDIQELEYIAKKHKDIKVIFVTHLLGFTSISRDSTIFSELFPSAIVLDDVCESHGCLSNSGNKIGSDSIGATFSTYFGHHLTSIEGGFVSTNDFELFDLMKMKRSHGMARESINYRHYADVYNDIDEQFLFITDGYNFRNTEINAVLGSSQLNKLDKSIEIRNKNYKLFCDMISKYENKFYSINFDKRSSNFCLPFITKDSSIKNELIAQFKKHSIEYRPVVSGNLLRHPFLQKYKICTKRKQTTVDLVHGNGVYIGNSQFVTEKQLNKLDTILQKI